MKNKHLIINMAASVISFAVNLGINLFLTPYIIRQLGSEAYSFIPISNNFIQYINILTAALNAMASRFITIELERDNIKSANKYFTSVLYANTILSIILVLPSIFLILNINKVLDVPIEILSDVQITFSFVAINLAISLIGNVFSVATFAKNKLYLSSIKTIEGNLLRIGIVVLLFVLFRPHIYFVTVSSLAGTIVTILGNIYYTKILLPDVEISRKYFSLSAIKQLLSLGVWNSLNQLSSVLLTSLDLLIANVCLGAAAGGQMSVAKNVPTLIQNLAGVLVNIFVPEFTILYAQNRKQELTNRVKFSVQMMGWLLTLPIGFLIVNGREFFMLWVPGENIELLYNLSLLTIIPMIISGSVNTIFNVFTVTGKLKIPAIVLLVSGVLNVAVVLIILNIFGGNIYTLPIVSAIILIIKNLVFTPIYAAGCLETKWYTFYISILKGVFCTMTMCGVTWLVKQVISCDSWLMFIASAAICAIIAMAFNFLVVFSKEDKKELVGFVVQRRMREKK